MRQLAAPGDVTAATGVAGSAANISGYATKRDKFVPVLNQLSTTP
jgi:hypothetical protein